MRTFFLNLNYICIYVNIIFLQIFQPPFGISKAIMAEKGGARRQVCTGQKNLQKSAGKQINVAICPANCVLLLFYTRLFPEFPNWFGIM